MSNSPRGIPLSSMLRELPVSDTKQLTFSSIKQKKKKTKQRGCINISFSSPKSRSETAQLWETPTSTKPESQANRGAHSLPALLKGPPGAPYRPSSLTAKWFHQDFPPHYTWELHSRHMPAHRTPGGAWTWLWEKQ